MYFIGLGRLYTDFGKIGAKIFILTLLVIKLSKPSLIIVENEDDFNLLKKLGFSNIFITNGSGLDSSKFKVKKNSNSKINVGYISRFGRSKYTDKIISLARTLPKELKLHVAGYDIAGENYSHKFEKLSNIKENIKFYGFISSREKISDFYNKIDLLLYPSFREGLPFTLLECVCHKKPFITTFVPGCIKIANEFNGVFFKPDDFQSFHLIKKVLNKNYITKSWDEKLKKYLSADIEEIFETKLFHTFK